jgi:hypothetical protein
MIVTLPHRYDLISNSCVNKEIQSFNRKLNTSVKNKDMIKIIDYKFTREDFTNHGLHLNSIGKHKIAQLITQHILTSENNFHNPIPMQWIATAWQGVLLSI